MKHLFLIPLLATALLAGCSTPPAVNPPLAATPVSQRVDAVVADGRVMPIRNVALNVYQTGTVAEVLVAEGAQVVAGQPLVRLDTRAAQYRLDQANANLSRVTAVRDRLLAGATKESIAIAQAGVDRAHAAATQVRAGVSNEDIAAAEAAVRDAQATRDALDTPLATDAAIAAAAVTQARANLEQQRTALSSAKTTAQHTMDQAALTLGQAQISYASARENWAYVQDNERDPFFTNMKLSDAQQQNYYDVYQRSESAMHVAELALQNATLAYQTAQTAESTGVAAAEARLADAVARQNALLAPDAGRLAAADARLASAKAALARLQGALRTAQLNGAAADVAQSESQYALVTAPPRAEEVAIAEADVQVAESAVNTATYDLEHATVVAPFAGVVTWLDATVGQLVTPATPVVTVADTSVWHVETEDLTELDVVHITVGDAVHVTFDALPDVELAGTISAIRPQGLDRQGDIVFRVQVALTGTDPRLHWNMTATVSTDK